jgi:hypothetical protein
VSQGYSSGGPSIDTDGNLAANSDLLIPSQKAVKTYVDSVSTGSITSLTGEVTATGPGASAATIANGAVSYAKLGADAISAFAVAAKGVTNGDSHDHNGGDGAQIAYSSLSGLPTLGTAAATASTDYAPAAKGVTNGDSHDHNGGDGAQIAYSSLSGTPDLSSLHARSHAVTSTSDHTAGNWKVFYSNGSGQVTELALGASGTYLKANGVSSAPTFETPPVPISSTTVAFTDGDTTRRSTVTDAAVSASSKIILTVRRPDTAATADRGYLYMANVVTVGTGSFDVLILALDESGGDCTELPPNETITLYYQVA